MMDRANGTQGRRGWRLALLPLGVLLATGPAGCGEAERSGDSAGESLPAVNDHAESSREILSLFPPIDFDPPMLDFGNVQLNDPQTRIVRVTNVGEQSVLILRATSNCGCTTPDVSDQEIAAGETFDLPVDFDAEGRTGHRSATVTLHVDGYERPVTFNVRAHVEPN